MMARLSRLIVLALLCAVSSSASAQAPQSAASQSLLTPAQLDQLVAPIALYPDPLLTQVLIASTYPLEVVQADRWAKSNANLKGDALSAAAAKQSWDDSVKSLVQVPSVLTMMSDQLDWTQKLGDAVLAQQADVMDSIQRLRSRAQANGKLQTTKQQTVSVKSGGSGEYIVIEPASPSEIYVPYYEPAVVYGAWPYPAYAPYYFPAPPGYVAAGALATGIAFGAGVAAGYAVWGNCDWGRHNVNVAVNRPVNINNINRNDVNFAKWEHNPDHRQGVRYNNADVRQKYAKTNAQAGQAARQDFRGRDGQQVLSPDRGGAGANDRAVDRGGNRATDRGGDRAGAGAGSTARDRPNAGNNAGQRDADRGAQGGAKQANRNAGGGGAQRASPQRDSAFSNVQSGAATRAQADRGRQSVQRSGGGGGGRPVAAAGGGGRGGGGAARGGGGGRGGRR